MFFFFVPFVHFKLCSFKQIHSKIWNFARQHTWLWANCSGVDVTTSNANIFCSWLFSNNSTMWYNRSRSSDNENICWNDLTQFSDTHNFNGRVNSIAEYYHNKNDRRNSSKLYIVQTARLQTFASENVFEYIHEQNT